MNRSPRGFAILSLSVLAASCTDTASLLTPEARQNSVAVPQCFARNATIYIGHPGAGTVIPNGSGGYTITGTSGVDVIIGSPGSDVIDGGDGADRICAGDGEDEVMGGSGVDRIAGGNGTDDAVYASSSAGVNVNLASGRGNGGDAEGDIIRLFENVTGSAHADVLIGDANANLLAGLGGADDLRGGLGDDELNGGSGADRLDGGAGADNQIGGTETDVTSFVNSPSGVTIVVSGSGSGGDAEGDTFNGVENVIGSSSIDDMSGDAAPNNLNGGPGSDVLRGGDEADQLFGGAGADDLHGDAGNDVLHGGNGTDDLYGGAGNDVIFGQDGADNLYGDNGDDDLRPGAGPNVVDGGPDTDILTSGSCIDTVTNVENIGPNRCADNVDVTQSTVQAASPDIAADNGTSVTTITIQLKNFGGTSLTLGGNTVVMMTDAGELDDGTTTGTTLTALDQSNGTYTLTLRSSTTIETATVTATVDGNAITGGNASVNFTFGPLDHLTIEAQGGGNIADQAAGVAFDVDITARDAHEHLVGNYTNTVEVTYEGGSGGSIASATMTNGILVQSVTINEGGSVQIRASADSKTGLSSAFNVSATPDAVDDEVSGTSAPSDAFHSAFNTDNTGAAGSLYANDALGFPAAVIESFGAIQVNDGAGGLDPEDGTVTTNLAGETVDIADGSLTVNADGSYTFDPPTDYTGLLKFQYILTSSEGSDDATVTLAVGVRPDAVDDSYSGGDLIGNVALNTNTGTIFTVSANDAGDNLTLSEVSETAGAATLNTNGTFEFTPNTGYAGSAGLEYRISNGFGTADASVALTVSSDRIWFVDRAAAFSGDGSLADPFQDLSSITNSSALPNPQDNDVIFLYENAVEYTGPFILRNGQKLIGQDAAATLAIAAGMTPATHQTLPVMNTSAPQVTITSTSLDPTLSLRIGNTLRGFTLGNTFTVPLFGSSFGTLTLHDVSIITNVQAMYLIDGTLSGGFKAVTSTSGPRNIYLENINSSVPIAFGGQYDDLSGASLSSIHVDGGTIQVTRSGPVTQANDAALLTVIGGHTGSVTLSGTVTSTDGTGLQFDNADGTYTISGAATFNGVSTGVNIANNSSGTFTFGSDVQIGNTTTPTATAFRVNDASPNVTYSGSITQGTAGQHIVEISGQASGTITFQNGVLWASNGTGIHLAHADGTVSFNGPTILNGGNAGVDVVGNSAGTITFGTGFSVSNPSGVAVFVGESAPASLTVNGAIVNNAGRAVEISNVMPAPCGTINIAATLASSGPSATGLLVNNCNTGVVTFSNASQTFETQAHSAVSLTDNQGATIRFTGGALALTTTAATAFSATGGGALVVSGTDNTIMSGATALHLHNVAVGDGGANGILFKSIDTYGAAAGGVNIFGVGQNLNSTGIDIIGGTLANVTSRGVDIDASVADIAIGSAISTDGTDDIPGGGRSVEVTNSGRADTGGSQIVFSGAINENGIGILLDNNDAFTNGATITFTGGLDIDTGASTGFAASNGGTVRVQGSGNSIESYYGTALSVENTTIGAAANASEGGLNFANITAIGGEKSIILNQTGGTAGLKINGTGTPGSGGTIFGSSFRGIEAIRTTDLSIASMDFVDNGTGISGAPAGVCGNESAGTTTGCAAAIHLEQSSNIALANVMVSGGTQIGINGHSVSGLTVTNVEVKLVGDEPLEDGVQMVDLTGTNTFTSVYFHDNASRQLAVQNSRGTGTLNLITSRFTNAIYPTPLTIPSSATAADGVLYRGRGTATMTLDAENSIFVQNLGAGVFADIADQASMSLTVNAGRLEGNGRAIQVAGTGSGSMDYVVSGSTINESVAGVPLSFSRGTPATGMWNGSIVGNEIGTSGMGYSGSPCNTCAGIAIETAAGGSGTYNATVAYNRIGQTGHSAIFVATTGGPNFGVTNLNVKIHDNTIVEPADGSGTDYGIEILNGTEVSDTEGSSICADVRANTISSGPYSWNPSAHILMRELVPNVLRIAGFAGGNGVQAPAFVSAQNSNVPTVISDDFQIDGGDDCF